MSDDRTPREPTPSATLACEAGVTPETLSAWRDGLLPADRAQWLAAHAPTCPACSARLRDYEQIGAALRGQIIPQSATDAWPALRLRIEREGRERRGRRLSLPRWGGLGALVAAALLVALFAGLLAQQAARRPAPGATATVAATHVASPTTTASPSGAGWTQISGYAGVYGLSVSPSVPSIAYQVWINDTGIVVRRTDDSGATWHTLPVPHIANATYPIFGTAVLGEVNPFDPHSVYLEIPAQMNDSKAPCLPKNVIPAFCDFQFISQDSGAHWRQITLPISGSLEFPTQPSDAFFQAQTDTSAQPAASRLYGMLNPLDQSGGRLVMSDDGVVWRLIDGDIIASGQRVSTFAATPTGSTVFAMSEPDGSQALSSAPQTIWRSDDAGATWTNLGPAPSNAIMAMTAGLVASSGKPMLYLLTARSLVGQSAYEIQGSLFGASGSFHVAPAPTPACTPAGNNYLLGTQPDGSVLIWCGGAVESWLAQPARVDQGWQTVATTPAVQTVQSAFIQRLPDGSRRLWVTTDDNVAAKVEYVTLPN